VPVVWCAFCGDPIEPDDDARSLPDVVYHRACWERRCAIAEEWGPALVVRLKHRARRDKSE
jgi:hypothetical protein